MLIAAETLKGYALNGLDGKFGTVKDVLFDELRWTVRFLVAATGGWLAERQVLLSPYALGPVMAAERAWVVNLTKGAIEGSPALKSEQRVPPQYESRCRSTNQIAGYHLTGSDGRLGNLIDVIVDDETWSIRYLIVDLRKWWRDKQVLISPRWAERISWDERNVFLGLSRASTKESPQYKADSLLTRFDEEALHRH